MQPIAQTIETARELERYQPELDVLAQLQHLADRVQQVVPEVIGMSVAWVDQGVAFTLVSTDEEIAALDGVQYLVGGPCVASVEVATSLEVSDTDLLDERDWQLFSQAMVATSVRSTLTLLLTDQGEAVGSVNLYAASDHAFEGNHDVLARLVGADVSTIICNADLAFTTRRAAEQAPEALRAQDLIDTAGGILAAALDVGVDEALHRLGGAAQRAGLSPRQFARALVALFD